MRYLATIILLLMCSVADAQSIVVSGGRRSIIASGRGVTQEARKAEPQPVFREVEPDPQPVRVKPVVASALVTERFLVSESWCPHCPAAKSRFLRSGGKPQNVITIAEARRRHGKVIRSVPAEYTVTVRRVAAAVTYRSQWPGRWSYNGTTTPSRDAILRHLRTDRNHRGKFWQSYQLESWTVQQLVALHDDDHAGRVQAIVIKPEQQPMDNLSGALQLTPADAVAAALGSYGMEET